MNTVPNFVHLSHWDVFNQRVDYLTNIAVAINPDITRWQKNTLRLIIKFDWIRHGGCWCLYAPRHIPVVNYYRSGAA